MSVKLIALDMDGTLLNSKSELSEGSLEKRAGGRQRKDGNSI